MRTSFLLLLLLLCSCRGGDSNTWADRAQDAIHDGDAKRARKAIDRALKLDASNAIAWRIACILAYDTSRFEDSEAHCTRAIDLTRDDPEYHALLNRGLARVKLNKLDGAYEDFQACKRLDPHNAEAYYDESWVWAARGDLDQVLQNVRLAGRYNPFYAYREVVGTDEPYERFHDDPRWIAFVETLVPGDAPDFPQDTPLLEQNPISGVPLSAPERGGR